MTGRGEAGPPPSGGSAGRSPHRPEEIAIHFGENLARLRRRARMSQEELAERASLHRTEVGSLERGSRGGRIDTLLKLAAGLEVAPEELLAGMAWLREPQGGGGRFVTGFAGHPHSHDRSEA